MFKNDTENQDTEVHKTFFVPVYKESINRKYEKQKPHMISQSDEPAPEK